MAGNGHPHLTVWTAPESGTGWLALDRDGDGLITSAKELFGNVTDQPAVGAPNGFLALLVFDQNEDYHITPSDTLYWSLSVWIDANQDGISQSGELHALSELGITSIDLNYKQSRRRDRYGNEFRFVGKIQTSQPWQRFAWDVNLANQM